MRTVDVSVTLLKLIPSQQFKLSVDEALTDDEVKAQVLTAINALADEHTAPADRLNGLGVWRYAHMTVHGRGTAHLSPPAERDAQRVLDRAAP